MFFETSERWIFTHESFTRRSFSLRCVQNGDDVSVQTGESFGGLWNGFSVADSSSDGEEFTLVFLGQFEFRCGLVLIIDAGKYDLRLLWSRGFRVTAR